MSASIEGIADATRLVLHGDYVREDVHDLFEPVTRFVPQAGLWGISGLIEIPGRPSDFVLLVTFGRTQGDHEFDEGISTEGILRWQSQPHQDLSDPRIQRLVHHDPDRNSVHLFLRTAGRRGGTVLPYTYLGRLRYDGHDRERSRPVHFRWVLLNWPIPDAVRTRMNLRLEGEFSSNEPASGHEIESIAIPAATNSLIEEAPPPFVDLTEIGESTRSFRAGRMRRPTDEETRGMGLAGELLVLERERHRLIDADRADLAAMVIHTAKVEGDGAGFDIMSFFSDGRKKFIEVKTTTGPKDTDFLITANEVAFSAAHPDDFELCRVFSFDRQINQACCYVLSGDIRKWLNLSPTEYRAKVQVVSAAAI